MVLIESFVAFIHRIDIYKVTIVFITNIIIIFLIYYCSFVYPVAVGVGRGASRGGTAQHDERRRRRPPSRPPRPRVLLDLLQRRALLPSPLLSPLDHRDEEQNQPTQRYRTTSHVEPWRIRIERVEQPPCKWRSY